MVLIAQENAWLVNALHVLASAMLLLVASAFAYAAIGAVKDALRKRRWRRANPEQQLAMIKAEFPLMAERVKPNVLEIFQRVARREMTPEEGAMRLGEIRERDDK